MNKKVLFLGAVSLVSFSALLAGDHKMAEMVSKIEANILGIKFKDTVGIPFTKDWKARVLLSFSVFNPTQLKFPLTIESISPIIGGKQVASLLEKNRTFMIESDYNWFKDLMFEVPLTRYNYGMIQSLVNPQIAVKARVYSLPITFTYNFNK